MTKIWKLVFLIIVPLLTSCGYLSRNSGFVERDWAEDSYYVPSMSKIFDNPRIEISTSCDGTNYTATFGPYIVLPLFIIPNPLWPFTYFHHTTKDAIIRLTISSKNEMTWEDISSKLILNGKSLELDRTEDVSEKEIHRRQFVYRSDLTCKELDDSEMVVLVTLDRSTPTTVNSKLYYKHRWKVDFNGI